MSDLRLTMAAASDVRAGALAQLRRLLRLRRDHADQMNDDGLRLLDISVTSALRSCDRAGAGDEAGGFIAGVNVVPGVFRKKPPKLGSVVIEPAEKKAKR